MNLKMKQALETMIWYAKADRLGATDGAQCVYRERGSNKRCVIGCLFDDAALDLLDARGLSGDVVGALYTEFSNLGELLGLTLAQAEELQGHHDGTNFDLPEQRDAFIAALEDIASGRVTGMDGVRF